MTDRKKQELKAKDENEFIFTKDEARVIRKFRVHDKGTWRWCAQEAALLWPDKGIAGGNQIDGMTLCREAAPFFNESSREKPWN